MYTNLKKVKLKNLNYELFTHLNNEVFYSHFMKTDFRNDYNNLE